MRFFAEECLWIFPSLVTVMGLNVLSLGCVCLIRCVFDENWSGLLMGKCCVALYKVGTLMICERS